MQIHNLSAVLLSCFTFLFSSHANAHMCTSSNDVRDAYTACKSKCETEEPDPSLAAFCEEGCEYFAEYCGYNVPK